MGGISNLGIPNFLFTTKKSLSEILEDENRIFFGNGQIGKVSTESKTFFGNRGTSETGGNASLPRGDGGP